jgi:hypothetical protein
MKKGRLGLTGVKLLLLVLATVGKIKKAVSKSRTSALFVGERLPEEAEEHLEQYND